VTYYKCGKEGHIAKYCRNQGGASTNGRSKEKAVAFAASRSKHQGWVIDSGSDTHLTPEVQMLEGYKKLDTPVKVEGFNGQVLEGIGKGTMCLQCKVGGNTKEVLLREVLHVPGASASLFSVRVAEHVGAEFLFKGGRCKVRMNGKVCMVGISVDGGLYVVD
jgi:hypothetical protein